MAGESRGDEMPAEVVLRMLGEYSARVSTGMGMSVGARASSSAFWGSVVVLVVLLGAGMYFVVERSPLTDDFAKTFAVVAVVAVAAVTTYVTKKLGELVESRRRPELELAVWQLRRIYQVASRMEDLGHQVDFATRFEFDLRLSEAQFLLGRAERLGITEALTEAEFASVRRERSVTAIPLESETTPTDAPRDAVGMLAKDA